MRPVAALLLAVVLAATGAAQTVPARGTEATFDVASWNIENFGSGSGAATQIQNVAAVIRQADVDLWALQEIVDASDFERLLQEIDGDGYAGVLGPDPQFGDQKLAYVYKRSAVAVIATRTILAGNEYAFAYRLPFEFRASVTVGGQTRSIRFLNVHAKCCGSSEDYDRRVDAATALKTYTDAEEADGVALVVLGDFNDRLNQSTLSGRLSPYRPFYTDTADYTIATRGLDPSGVTFCSNNSCTAGSPIDHILFTSALEAEYEADSGDRFGELVSAIQNYTATTSDHLPVLARFAFRATAVEADPEAGPVALLAPAPSPFRSVTALRFRLDAPADVTLDVVDALGRRVASAAGAFGAGTHALPLQGAGLAPGVYMVRLTAGGEVRSRTVVRAR